MKATEFAARLSATNNVALLKARIVACEWFIKTGNANLADLMAANASQAVIDREWASIKQNVAAVDAMQAKVAA